ncbi:protein of unknown function [Acidithiobacillus ferrivorans]|uniref:Uncharacterized protein n=1 Tax=Acidithiobacillus ferrivorans TaxID=160808 RepID=A0A060UNH8_9PROT|nr:hypothetical protein [Acidithiobacillus ferrivorans]CDQ10202.1 hypothetical protein AFERRI_40154 [Acidithiobacillus ferrivorans]SMH64162.1 protein of unknown function [Acidithiobacillus ferrivorans]
MTTTHHQNCEIRARQAHDSTESLAFLKEKDPTYRENFRQIFIPASTYAVFNRTIELHNHCQLSHGSKEYLASIYHAYNGKNKDVLCLFLHDLSRSEIAEHLRCSEKTITNALALLVQEIEQIVSSDDLPDTELGLPLPEDIPARANYRNAGRRRICEPPPDVGRTRPTSGVEHGT